MTVVGTKVAEVSRTSNDYPHRMGTPTAQVFTPSQNISVEHAHLYPNQNNVTAQSFSVGLASALLTGDPATDASVTWMSKQTITGPFTGGQQVEINFPTPVQLTAGVTYFLVAQFPDMTAVNKGVETDGVYTGGTHSGARYGTDWASSNANYSLRLELYGSIDGGGGGGGGGEVVGALTEETISRLRKAGLNNRSAKTLSAALADPATVDWESALRRGDLTPRQMRTLKRLSTQTTGLSDLAYLLRGGFTRAQAKLILGG